MQYIKIKQAISEQIDSGNLTAGQKLPPERKFAEMFSTTRVTLREALSMLEAEGRIYREERRGWFISPEPFSYDPSSSVYFVEKAAQLGLNAATRVVSAEEMLAPKEATEWLELPPFSGVYCLERVRSLDSRDVGYIKSYISPEKLPGLLDADLTLPLSTLYESVYGQVCQSTRYRIRSTSLSGEVAQQLKATPGTPALLINRTRFDRDGNAIDASVEYWRHDAVQIEISN